MKRRAFISLLGGAVVAWPLAARAQQPDQMRRIGVLMGYAESDLEAQAWVTAFVQGFKELGWIVGRNVSIDYRFGAGDADRMRAYAAAKGDPCCRTTSAGSWRSNASRGSTRTRRSWRRIADRVETRAGLPGF
jgi:hypothetical protein